MFNRKIIGLTFCSLMLGAVLLAGCVGQQAAEAPRIEERPQSVTITDAKGQEITVGLPVERIVALHSDGAVAIRALGAADRVVGVNKHMVEDEVFFTELSKLPSVGGSFDPDIEAVLALEPDIVIAYAKWPGPEKLEEKLVGTGITVVRLDFFKAKTLIEEARTLGKILQKEEEAAAYIAWHDEHVKPIEEAVALIPEEDKIRVFVEWSPGGGGKEFGRRAMGAGTGMDDLVVTAGGINLAAEVNEGYFDVETEWILAENPEVYIGRSAKEGYSTADHSELAAEREIIMGLPGFGKATAVLDDRVYLITGDLASGLQHPAALATVARWLYPEKFADLDPVVIHQEFIDRFTGLDLNVTTQGAFVYPPLPSK
jgi:iron complex transport system substrate-binding protein